MDVDTSEVQHSRKLIVYLYGEQAYAFSSYELMTPYAEDGFPRLYLHFSCDVALK